MWKSTFEKEISILLGVCCGYRWVDQIQKTELPARRIVHDVCDIVTMRSARLAAAGIVGILKKIGGDSWDTTGPSGTLKTINRHSRIATGTKFATGKIVVAMDGGLYEHYTQYRIYMQAAVNELLSEATAKRLVIELSKDGSGIGATILAACHSNYRY
jgi:hexokinase